MCDRPCAIIAHYQIPGGPCACKLCIAHFLWSTVPVWVKCVIVPLLVLPIVGSRSTSNTWWALLVIVLNVHSRKWNRRKIVDNEKLDLIYLGAWIPMTFNPVITFPLSDHHTTTDTTSDHHLWHHYWHHLWPSKCVSENQNIQAANSTKIKLRRVVSYGRFNTERSEQ